MPKIQSHRRAQLVGLTVFAYPSSASTFPLGRSRRRSHRDATGRVSDGRDPLRLRNHAVALNCGRWDYIFSYIKTLRKHRGSRAAGSSGADDGQAVSQRLLATADSHVPPPRRTCDGRHGGVHSEQGSATRTNRRRESARRQNLEATNGHDGTWVAHPGLADLAMEVSTATSRKVTQPAGRSRSQDPVIKAADLLAVPAGERTEAGMRTNIRVSIQYIEAWISGTGCVPVYGLMEDAATVEISRASIWQWITERQTALERQDRHESVVPRDVERGTAGRARRDW